MVITRKASNGLVGYRIHRKIYCYRCAEEIDRDGRKVPLWESTQTNAPLWCAECGGLVVVTLSEAVIYFIQDAGLDEDSDIVTAYGHLSE